MQNKKANADQEKANTDQEIILQFIANFQNSSRDTIIQAANSKSAALPSPLAQDDMRTLQADISKVQHDLLA
jgi:hypothetical protein